VFAVRRQGRMVAAALGLEGQDQIRVAAALSEVSRRLLAEFGTLSVSLTLESPDTGSPAADSGTGRTLPSLLVRLSASGSAGTELIEAVRPTKALMDFWELTGGSEQTVVSMSRRLPERAISLSDGELQSLRDNVAGMSAGTPMEELAEHNRQLLSALLEVQAQRDELLRLNSELEETNKGVVALYTELSVELEATNRGVVALYAELDERTSQLRSISEAKTRFLANVSHELRSPVTSMLGLIRLLRDPASDPISEEQDQQLQLIDGSAKSLLGLVNELLDLAKAESGRLDPHIESVELAEVFDTLRGTLRAVPHSDDTTLEVVDPEGIPPVCTDPLMLTQVLRNLLTNALKFTPSGSVRMTASTVGERISLAVADTGIGIPLPEQERIFEEFHQVRNPLQATVTGTGLGLPYARRLVELLGGELTVVSEPGAGSTFTVSLPLIGAVPPPPAPDTTVLVADDDEGFRRAAAEVLRRGGFTVLEAADGRTALLIAQAQPPDLILLDLRLAEMDGFTVLATLSSESALRAIPVIVITAYPQDLVEKPVSRRALTILDKTRTTLDDLCGVVRSTVPRQASP
jgi:signal transduction histidine kinase